MAQVLGRGLGMPFAVRRQYLGPARLAVDSRSEHERRHIRAALRRAHDRLLEDPSESCSHRKPILALMDSQYAWESGPIQAGNPQLAAEAQERIEGNIIVNSQEVALVGRQNLHGAMESATCDPCLLPWWRYVTPC